MKELEALYSSELFETLFSSVEEGVLITDEKLVVLEVNSTIKERFGIDRKEIVGKLFFDSFKGDLNFGLIGKISLGVSHEVAGIIIISENKKIPVKVKIKKIQSGKLGVGFLIFVNTTNGDALLTDEFKFQSFFNNSLEGVFILNDSGFIVNANPVASEIYDCPNSKLIGQHIFELFPNQSNLEKVNYWESLIRDGSLKGLYKYKVSSGELKYIEFKTTSEFLPGFHLALFRDVTKQTVTDKALNLSEANLKAIFSHAKQQYILLDKELKILTFNEAAYESTLKTVNKHLEVGRLIWEYGVESTKVEFLQAIERVEKGEVIFIEAKPPQLTSGKVWFDYAIIPVFDNSKVFKGVLLSINDISHRKKIELDLQESEARFKSLAQNSSDIIIIIDKDFKIKYTSTSISKILGYSEQALLDKSFLDFLHEDDSNRVYFELVDLLGGNFKKQACEYRFQHTDGVYLFLETNFNNLLSDKHIEGIVLHSRDVTERKNQEENLLLLQRAINSSNNGIIISDPTQSENPVIYVNKAFEQITGYSAKETLGTNVRFLQGKETNQPEVDKIRRAIDLKKETRVILKNYKKDGSLFWNQLSISPVFNRAGELSNFIGVVNDITEKKIAEDALLEITQRVSFSSEQNILQSLVTHIGITLKMDYVLVTEHIGTQARTKAFWTNGGLADNFEYNLEGTPCNNVLKTGSCLYYWNVTDQFPGVEIFKNESIDSYMGIALKNSDCKPIGVLSVMSKKPFNNIQLSENILNIFSVRASFELERDTYVEALKFSENRFKDLAKNSPDIIYIIDLELRKITYFNRAEILGYNSNELTTSESWESKVHYLDVERVKLHWKKFVESNGIINHSIEYRILNKSGMYEWVSNRHIVLEKCTNGNPCKILLNITLVTERKKTEDALRDSEARLLGLIENTNDIVWSVDKSFVFTAMNTSFKRLFEEHYSAQVQVGNNLLQHLPVGLRDEWIEMHQRALGGERFSFEFNVKSYSEQFSYEITYNPIYTREGLINGVSAFGRDITQRKLTENDIIRTNFELDSFVYRASHDLRAPLRSVLGLVNLAKSEAEVNDRNSYLGLVEKSINKLDTFIADLTNFSRNSRLEISISRIEFKSTIEDCLENLKYMDNADRIKTIVNCTGDAVFYSDKTRINIVFQNIISNAIKYQNLWSEESVILIDIRVTPISADIIISDNGKGIRGEYLDKIFNMFFRASQESYGSGLGLYITKQVVEKLNGKITVSSELGSGTKFNINLPNLKVQD